MGLSVAARYTNPTASEFAFANVTRALARDNLRLSAFRFKSGDHWYIAVVGEEDELKVFVPLANILAERGTIIALPDKTHDELLERRAACRA